MLNVINVRTMRPIATIVRSTLFDYYFGQLSPICATYVHNKNAACSVWYITEHLAEGKDETTNKLYK